MAIFRHQGIAIYYEVIERPGAPWLVFSNSLGTSMALWAPQLQEFAKHFSVLRYDSRVHGQSAVPAGPYDIAMLGQDVLALANELKIARFHFCGLSLGGMVGQWLGVHAPRKIENLVLCNTAAKVGTSEGWNARIQKVQSGGMAAVTEDVLTRWFTESFRAAHPEPVEATRKMLLGTNPEGYVATCAAVRDMDLREDISSINARTLIVYGTEDVVTTAQDAEFLAARISAAAKLRLVAAHLSNIEAASAFTIGVLDFLIGGLTT